MEVFFDMNNPDDLIVTEGAQPEVAASPNIVAPADTITQAPEAIAEFDLIASSNEAAPKKRGRPSKADTAAKLNSVNPAPPRPAPVFVATQPIPVDYEKLARMAANLWFNAGELIFGSDWQPQDNEPTVIKDSFKDYFKDAGVTNIPPAWGLAVVLFSYGAARVTKPTVKSRFTNAALWLRSKVKR